VPLRMLDSVTVANLPPGADAYLGYVGGRWPTWPALQARFPHARLVSTAISADEDAECCDREPGDLDVGEIALWVKRQLARGVHRPIVYASASNMGECLHWLTVAGIRRAQVRLLSAHYAAGQHICGPHTCDYPGCPPVDGTQWRDNAPGTGRSRVDESMLADDFFAVPPAAARTRRPPEDDDMLISRGKGAKTPVALGDGAVSVRLFASEPATVLLDLRDGKPGEVIKLAYGSAAARKIPDGVHAIVVHRSDPGVNDVSLAVTY
jgi:hypothetical protein